jgi:hypothetical protein
VGTDTQLSFGPWRFCAIKIVKATSEAEARRLIAVARRLIALARRPVSGNPNPRDIACDEVGDARDAPAAVRKSLGDDSWIWLTMCYIHGPNALELAQGDAKLG